MKPYQRNKNVIRWMTGIAVACMMAGMASAQEAIAPIKVAPESPMKKNSVFKNSTFNKPIVVKSKEEAAKYFGKEAVATLVKAVDFKKQFVLVFAWRGSGGDQLNYTVAESFPEQITFSRQFGRTRDLRGHAKVFALRSNVKWSVMHTLVRSLQAKDSLATERIQALKPNQAVLLSESRVVGDFNAVAKRWNLHKTGPRGRDFTIKMVWAPERKRVLFCGANHGVPHRLNDVWEFDLSALTWFMLYAPDNPRDYTGLGKDFSDVEFKDGIFITKRGGPAIIAHTWWGLTYDPEQKMMLFMNTWVTNKKKMVELLGGDPDKLYAGPPLWGFSPASGQWKMLKTPPPAPRPIFGGWLEYVPELKGTLWHANNWQMRASWLYDAKSGAWKNLQANGSKEKFQKHAATPEQVGYYDPKRRILVAQRHKETFHYTPATNRWEKVLSMNKESKEVPYGHDAYSPMYHDPVSGHGLLVEFKTNTLWVYDPDRRKWTKLAPEGDPMPTGKKRLAYFDPTHNVFVIIEGTTVWVYRYQSG